MNANNNNSKTKNGFMLFSLVMVVILSFSVSVVLYLFLAKNGSNNREFFKTKFDENEVNDGLTKIKNMKSEIVRVSKSMETKSTELKEIKIEKNKLIEKLEVAKKDADKRKVDQKILSITTPAGELPSNPVIAKTEIKHLVETVDDNLKKMADAKKFDEKMLKNSAIGLNEELKKFISNKEKEALNNPYFKATYGRDWVAFVNDLKNKGKESVFSGLDIKNVKDKPNSLKGMESLKNLLLQTKVEELNYYFAFDYFKEHFTNNEVNRKKLLNELFNLPNVTTMARQVPIPPQEMDKEKIKKIQTANEDEVKQRNLKIENKVTEYLGYLKKYEDFYNKLNADNK